MLIMSGATAALTLIEHDFVAVDDALSVALKVKLDAPGVVGVPSICPRCGSRLRLAGNCPLASDHEYGGVPPVAFSEAEYVWPTVPLLAGQAPIDTPAIMISDKLAVAEADALSVTFTLNGVVPAALGTPKIAPPALNDKLCGSDPAAIDQLYGGVPPTACKLCE